MSRYFLEGRMPQGVDERISYAIDTTPWGGSPSGVVVAVKTMNIDGTLTDVTSTVMPTNAPTVSGDDITLSLLQNLTAGILYRIEVKMTIAGNVFESVGVVRAEV